MMASYRVGIVYIQIYLSVTILSSVYFQTRKYLVLFQNGDTSNNCS